MITMMFLSALLSAPTPHDLLMLQDTLDQYYNYPYIELYSCPVPSVDHYRVCESELLTEPPLFRDDWFVIGDTLVSRGIDPSMFLFEPADDDEAVEVAKWLASLRYCDCEAISVDAMPEGVYPQPRGIQLYPCAMTRYSAPIKLSWVLGVSFNRMTGYRSYRAFFAQVEPGFGGGKLNLGYRFGEIHFIPAWNLGLNASVLQTWGNPLGDVEAGQTYLGIELSGAFLILGLNGGVFMHVAGDDEDHELIYSLGVGAGI